MINEVDSDNNGTIDFPGTLRMAMETRSSADVDARQNS